MAKGVDFVIRVKRVFTGGITKSAEKKLEELLNEIGEENVVNVLKGVHYNQILKSEMVSYTVIYRE